MSMKQPMSPVPGPFRALIAWMERRFGLVLKSRINFTRGFAIDGVEFSADDAHVLRSILDAETKKQPRNKHPAKARDAPPSESDDDNLI